MLVVDELPPFPEKGGSSVSAAGQVIGSLPVNVTGLPDMSLPNISLASAEPPDWPGYQAITSAGTVAIQLDTSIALPPSRMTAMGLLGLADTIWRMTLFCAVPPCLPSSARL